VTEGAYNPHRVKKQRDWPSVPAPFSGACAQWKNTKKKTNRCIMEDKTGVFFSLHFYAVFTHFFV